MNEQDLFDAWKQTNDQEKQVLEQYSNEIQKRALVKSNDVFAKIKRNIYSEGILSIIIAIIFPFLFWNEPIFFWVGLVVMGSALAFTLKVYKRYLDDLKNLNECSIIESLRKKITILSRYIKQLKFYAYVFAPVGFVFGMSFSMKQEEFEIVRFLFISAFAMPFLILVLWLINKYIQTVYGKYLVKVEQLYSNLIEGNNEEV